MENILLAVDSSRFDKSTLDFACYIANLTHSSLTGIFLENQFPPEIALSKSVFGTPYAETIIASNISELDAKTRIVNDNIRVFRDTCLNNCVKCYVHHMKGIPAEEILAESRYADIIIVGPETSFERKPESLPTHFVRDLLQGAECPVIIAPYSFEGIEELLFTYDGSKSSVFAIKQFAHIFRDLDKKKVTVVEVKEENSSSVEKRAKISEWLKKHYSEIDFQVLYGKASDELFAYLLGKKNIFAVMGAFGRGVPEGLFKKSTASYLVKAIDFPLFVAHY